MTETDRDTPTEMPILNTMAWKKLHKVDHESLNPQLPSRKWTSLEIDGRPHHLPLLLLYLWRANFQTVPSLPELPVAAMLFFLRYAL